MPGTVLLREGSPGDSMMVISKGWELSGTSRSGMQRKMGQGIESSRDLPGMSDVHELKDEKLDCNPKTCDFRFGFHLQSYSACIIFSYSANCSFPCSSAAD